MRPYEPSASLFFAQWPIRPPITRHCSSSGHRRPPETTGTVDFGSNTLAIWGIPDYHGLKKKFDRARYDLGLTKVAHRVLPNAAPFDAIASDLVGKRYTTIIDKLRAEYRNVFAHFSSDEPMSPLNPQDEERAARASSVLKRIAIDAIADARRYVSQLAATGWTETDIAAALAAVDTAEKVTA